MDADLDGFEEDLTDRFGPLPAEAEALAANARIGLLARAARVDAGPAAIALTPAPGFAGDAKALGLEAKNGRLLLREETTEEERPGRVLALLETLTE